MKKIYLLTATFFALTYNVFAQNPTTCSAVYDDFSNPALWIHPPLPPNLQNAPNFNTISVTGGKFSFGQSRDNNMNYMYRSGIAISNTDFKAEIDFRHTSNGITAGGAGHVVLALNSSMEPFFSSISSAGGSPMSLTPLVLTPTNHQGIAITFESDLTTAPTDFLFKVF